MLFFSRPEKFDLIKIYSIFNDKCKIKKFKLYFKMSRAFESHCYQVDLEEEENICSEFLFSICS